MLVWIIYLKDMAENVKNGKINFGQNDWKAAYRPRVSWTKSKKIKVHPKSVDAVW
jgi:hypothetical protein